MVAPTRKVTQGRSYVDAAQFEPRDGSFEILNLKGEVLDVPDRLGALSDMDHLAIAYVEPHSRCHFIGDWPMKRTETERVLIEGTRRFEIVIWQSDVLHPAGFECAQGVLPV